MAWALLILVHDQSLGQGYAHEIEPAGKKR